MDWRRSNVLRRSSERTWAKCSRSFRASLCHDRREVDYERLHSQQTSNTIPQVLIPSSIKHILNLLHANLMQQGCMAEKRFSHISVKPWCYCASLVTTRQRLSAVAVTWPPRNHSALHRAPYGCPQFRDHCELLHKFVRMHDVIANLRAP
jgi:hypothetical protein